MYTRRLALVLVLAATLASGRPAQQKGPPKTEDPRAKKKAAEASLTDRVDQEDGHYVLVDDRSLNPIANLEPDSFPVEGFAKHVGHKVAVRGTSSATGSRPTFKVRATETCTPQQANRE